jgi:steroid delta-isomerase
MLDHARCHAWRHFLETLRLDSIPRLEQLAAPDIHYHDPFVDARGRDNVKRVFAKMFEDIDEPRFTFTHCACDGDTCFLRWHFTCRPKSIRQGLPWICDGVTEVRFDAEGRVAAHFEHWDAGEQVYEKLPVLRAIIRLVKRRVSGWSG